MVHNMRAPCMQSQVFTLWPQMPRRRGQTKAKHTQPTLGSPGPLWHCRGPRNHDNDTVDVAGGQLWSITCAHRVCKAKFSLLGPQCPVGEAKPRRSTHNSQLAHQGSFGTAEGRETITTKPKSLLEVNTGLKRARTVYAAPCFHSLAPNAPSVSPN